METFIIETGNYRHLSRGNDMTEAAIKIFKKYAPENPSILTRMAKAYPLKRKRGEGVWYYIDTRVLLKKAGYKVEKETKNL